MPDNVLETKFTADVADALKGIIELKETIASIGKVASQTVSDFGKLTTALNQLVSNFTASTDAASVFQKQMTIIGTALSQTAQKAAQSSSAISSSQQSLSQAATSASVYQQALFELQTLFGKGTVAYKTSVIELNKLEKEYQAISSASGELGNSLTWIYDKQTLVSKSIENWIQNTKKATTAQKNLRAANELLNTGLTDVALSQTVLGRAILSTSEKGKSFYDALVKGGQALGVNTSEISRYVASLKDVHKHLLTVSDSSINYKAAQSELANSSKLQAKALSLMDGEIVKVSNGFLALSPNAKSVGTTMNEYTHQLERVTQANAKFSDIFVTLADKYKNQPILLRSMGESIIQYSDSLGQVRETQRKMLNDLLDINNGLIFHKDKLYQTKEASILLNTEKGKLTKELQKESNILKFLASGYNVSKEGLMKFVSELMSGSLTAHEFNKELSGFNSTLQKLGSYGLVYADTFKKSTENLVENRGAVEASSDAHLKYARTAEQLIFQMGEYVKIGKSKAAVDVQTTGDIEVYNKTVSGLNSEYQILINTLRNSETITKSVSESTNLSSQSMLAYAERAGLSNEASIRLGTAVEKLKTKYEELRPQVRKIQTDFVTQNLTYEQARQKLNELEKAHEAYIKSLQQQETWLSKIITKMKEFVSYFVAASAIYAVTVALREGVFAMANYDQSLSNLQAITGSTRSEVLRLGEEMKKASGNTIYSIQEISDGVKIMGQAGLTVQQSIQALQPTLDLAMGTLEKMEPVVDLLTSTMVSFGKEAFQVSEISDIMAVAINRSKLDIEKLRTIFNYIGVSAAQAGLSLKETAASAMVLADSGMKASTIGTGLRNVISKLIAPNIQLRQTFQAMNISMSDLNPTIVGYDRALQNLSLILVKSSTDMYGNKKAVGDAALAYQLFGLRGAQAALALSSAYSSGKYREIIDSLDETGASAKMAAIQMDGLEARFKNMIAQVKLFAVSLGDLFLVDTFKSAISVVTGFFTILTKTVNFFTTSFVSYFIAGLASIILYFKAFTLISETALGAVFINKLNVVALKIKSFVMFTGTYLKQFGDYLMTAFITPHPITALLAALTTVATTIWMLSIYAKKQVEQLIELSKQYGTTTTTLQAFSEGLSNLNLTQEEHNKLLGSLSGKYPDFANELAKTAGRASLSKMSFTDLTKTLGKLYEKFGNTEAYQFFIQNIEESIKSSSSYSHLLKELKEQFPALYKEIVKVSVASKDTSSIFNEVFDNTVLMSDNFDIASLSLSQLKDVMKKVEELKFNESLNNLGTILRNHVLGEFGFFVQILQTTSNWLHTLINNTENNAITQEQFAAAVKTTKEILIQYALINKNVTEEMIDNQLKMMNITSKAFTEIKKGLMDEIVFRRESQQVRKEVTAKIKDDLAGLTIFEKIEMQKSLRQMDEELAAFRKLSTDKVMLEEDFVAVSHAIRIKYYLKSLQMISDYSKKENETFKQKYEREKELLTKQIFAIYSINKDYLLELEQLQKQNAVNTQKQMEGIKSAIEYGEREIEKIKERARINELNNYITRSNSILSVLEKQNNSISSLMSKSEEDKKLTRLKYLQEELSIVSKQLEAEEVLYARDEEKINTYRNKELEYKQKILEQENQLIEMYLKKFEEAYDGYIEVISSKYNKEAEAIKTAYDKETKLLSDRFATETALIDINQKNALKAEQQKGSVRKTYVDEMVTITNAATQKLIKLSHVEASEAIQALKTKYSERIKYLDAITSFGEEAFEKLKTIIYKETQETERSLQARGVLYKKELDKIYIGYDELSQKEIRLQEATSDKINFIFLKQTNKNKQYLDDEGLAYKQFGDKFYQVYATVGESIVALTKKQFDEFNKLHNMFSEINRQIQSELTTTENANTETVKKMSKERLAILFNEVRAQKRAFEEQKKSLESLYQAEVGHYNSLFAKKASIQKTLKNLDDQYKADLFDLQIQDMTNYQKYSETIKRIHKLMNQAQLTEDMSYLDAAKNLVKGLHGEITDSAGNVIKSVTDTTKEQISLMAEIYQKQKEMGKAQEDEVNKQLQDSRQLIDQLKSNIDEVEKSIAEMSKTEMKLKNDEAKKSLDEVSAQVTNLDNLIKQAHSLEIDITKYVNSIGEAKKAMEDLNTFYEISKSNQMDISILEKDSGKKATEALDEVKAKAEALQKTVSERKAELSIQVSMKLAESGTKSFSEGSAEIMELLDKIQKQSETSVNLNMNVNGTDNGIAKEFTTLLDDILQKVSELVDKSIIYTIIVTGLDALISAIDYQNQLHDTSVTHTITTVYRTESSSGSSSEGIEAHTGGFIGGMARRFAKGGFNGALSGYGGGDMIPAWLEPGEFVLRKEAVKKYGLNLLSKLNGMVVPDFIKNITSKFQSGGSVGQNLLSSQPTLHVIEFKVGGSSTKLYGESNQIEGLIRNLRRSKLVTV